MTSSLCFQVQISSASELSSVAAIASARSVGHLTVANTSVFSSLSRLLSGSHRATRIRDISRVIGHKKKKKKKWNFFSWTQNLYCLWKIDFTPSKNSSAENLFIIYWKGSIFRKHFFPSRIYRKFFPLISLILLLLVAMARHNSLQD